MIVCILGAVLVYQYAMSKQTYTAQTVLRYSNSEASNGLTPSGDSLDVSEIYSSKVITGVLEDLDLNTGLILFVLSALWSQLFRQMKSQKKSDTKRRRRICVSSD